MIYIYIYYNIYIFIYISVTHIYGEHDGNPVTSYCHLACPCLSANFAERRCLVLDRARSRQRQPAADGIGFFKIGFSLWYTNI